MIHYISGASQYDKLEILSYCSAPSAAKCKILPLCPSILMNHTEIYYLKKG